MSANMARLLSVMLQPFNDGGKGILHFLLLFSQATYLMSTIPTI